MKSRIIYEDNHLIAVNKECGEIVQADKTGDGPLSQSVAAYLKETYKKPGNVFLGIIHRLDRPTSGVVLYAKTGKALSRMNALFKEQKVRKVYWAVLNQMPPQMEGVLEHYLVRDRKKNKSFTVSAKKKQNVKHGILSYCLVGATKNYYLVEIDLKTGRHHQIRAQLAAVGCSIRGDLKYGAPRSNENGGIHLHARNISFQHPVKDCYLEITAQPPQDQLWQEFIRIREK